MSYHKTLEEDLARAKTILARADAIAGDGGYPVIVDDDNLDTYLLVQSFVAEIERLHAQYAGLSDRRYYEQQLEALKKAEVENSDLRAEIERLRDENGLLKRALTMVCRQ